VKVELAMDADGRLADVGFTGTGCAICTASASMMTESVRGKTREEVDALFHGFTELVKGEREPEDVEGVLGKLAVFAGVREFPVRVKCATLPWHTLHAAAAGDVEPVTTE
jgi:nitrogen fixation protein NifU and related proteins